MSQFKKGVSVRFKSRVQSGTGKIAAIRKTEKGPWYDVKKPDGKTISLRAAQMKAA